MIFLKKTSMSISFDWRFVSRGRLKYDRTVIELRRDLSGGLGGRQVLLERVRKGLIGNAVNFVDLHGLDN
jgi:hypothetical protein